MDDIDALAVTTASDGSVFLTIRKGTGYTDEYCMDARTAQFLFSEMGTVLKRLPEGDDNE
jgi:hypothetical protein